ncbi:MAG: DUF2190 family protein [Candidatus Heimdallarchaeaceae archaeon]
MAVNPNGYVPIYDGGTPRIITGYAREVISGGWLVGGSTAAGVVSSGADSFASSDILFTAPASGNNFIGIALANAASGAPLAVATRGAFIVTAAGDVLAGEPVVTDGENAVVPGGSDTPNIGRAFTAAGSEEYCVVDIHG